MSQGLIQTSVLREILDLARLACTKDTTQFQHVIITSSIGILPVTEVTAIDFDVPENMCLIVTHAGARSLPLPTGDALLSDGDFRSSEDVNPYGPNTAGSDYSYARWQINTTPSTPQIYTQAILNTSCLLVFSPKTRAQLLITANLPPATMVGLVVRVNCYLAPAAIAECLAFNQTTFIDYEVVE